MNFSHVTVNKELINNVVHTFNNYIFLELETLVVNCDQSQLVLPLVGVSPKIELFMCFGHSTMSS